MYGLYPVAYPIAKLLDHVLGINHGIMFNRAGLKSFIKLHSRPSYALAERLHQEEVAVISSVLDLNETPVSSIMTPISKLFTLSFDDYLDDKTRGNILSAGYSNIPIHLHAHPATFVGVLSVKSLVVTGFVEEMRIGQLTLDILPVVRPGAASYTLFNLFRDEKVQMALVTHSGTPHGEPLGIVTARDVINKLMTE